MSGHSKWATIKHKKAITDQKRGQLFSKLSKLISISAKGNPDPDTNVRLRSALEKAKKFNLPNNNIEKAIKKSADKNAAQLEYLQIEMLAPENVAIIAEAITDNRNRTISELKHLALKLGIKTANEGSLSWMFTKTGLIKIPVSGIAEGKEDIEMDLIECGAEDLKKEDEVLFVFTKPEDLYTTTKNIEDKLNLAPKESDIVLVPKKEIELSDPKKIEQLENILNALEEHDDIENIYSNLK